MEMKEFTQKLAQFFKEELNASDEACIELEECEDFYDIRCCLEDSIYIKDLAGVDYLKNEIDSLEDEVDSLKTENRELNSLLNELEEEISAVKFHAITYWDEEKYEVFLKYHDKFSSAEFERLLTENK